MLWKMRFTVYFNSQPHEEADAADARKAENVYHISTHSLTKRLTARLETETGVDSISTHSLTKRLT